MINIFKNKSPNLFSFISKHSEKIEKTLLNYDDLELTEKFPHWWKSKKYKFTFTIYWGKPIWYSKNKVYLWHKLVIRGNNAEENLKIILKKLNLQPFKDSEHFPNGFHYNKKTKTISCYVNPDFPNGITQTSIK